MRVPARERGPVRIGALLPTVLAHYGIDPMSEATADEIKLSKADVAKYLKTREERLALDRQSAALAKQEATLFGRIFAYAKVHAGRKRVCEAFGYVFALCFKPGAIAWKQEYIAACGPDAANAITAPPKESVTITKLP
jgi:hypothetical protein